MMEPRIAGFDGEFKRSIGIEDGAGAATGGVDREHAGCGVGATLTGR
jgi:hypothetical protein